MFPSSSSSLCESGNHTKPKGHSQWHRNGGVFEHQTFQHQNVAVAFEGGTSAPCCVSCHSSDGDKLHAVRNNSSCCGAEFLQIALQSRANALLLNKQSQATCNCIPDNRARENPESGTDAAWGSNRSTGFLGSEKLVGISCDRIF